MMKITQSKSKISLSKLTRSHIQKLLFQRIRILKINKIPNFNSKMRRNKLALLSKSKKVKSLQFKTKAR